MTVAALGLVSEVERTRRRRFADVAVKVGLLSDYELEAKDKEEQELVWRLQEETRNVGVLAVVFIVQREAKKSRRAVPSHRRRHGGVQASTTVAVLEGMGFIRIVAGTVAVVIHFDCRQRRG
jgi:hypothetical protein